MLLQRQYAALDRADAGGGNIAVLGLKIARVVADVLEQGAKVLEIEQQQSVVVGDLEREGKHAFLGFVEVQDARKQQRPQVRDRRPHRVAGFAEYIPENGRKPGVCRRGNANELQPLVELWRACPRLAHPGEVPLDVGHEDRHA